MKLFRNEEEAKRKLAEKIEGLEKTEGARAFLGMQLTPNRGHYDYKAVYIVPMEITYLDLLDFGFFKDFSIKREFVAYGRTSSAFNREFNEFMRRRAHNCNRITSPLSFNGQDIGAYRYYYPRHFFEEHIINFLSKISD